MKSIICKVKIDFCLLPVYTEFGGLGNTSKAYRNEMKSKILIEQIENI